MTLHFRMLRHSLVAKKARAHHGAHLDFPFFFARSSIAMNCRNSPPTAIINRELGSGLPPKKERSDTKDRYGRVCNSNKIYGCDTTSKGAARRPLVATKRQRGVTSMFRLRESRRRSGPRAAAPSSPRELCFHDIDTKTTRDTFCEQGDPPLHRIDFVDLALGAGVARDVR